VEKHGKVPVENTGLECQIFFVPARASQTVYVAFGVLHVKKSNKGGEKFHSGKWIKQK
jgi:hypothetical protein